METIAVTYWNGIISPMFDASCCLLVVHADGRRCFIDVKKMSLFEKIECCSKQRAKVVMCGAISNVALRILGDEEIKVLSWVRGSVEEIISAYRKDLDVMNLFSMPGCNRKMCGRKRRFRHQGKLFDQ